ncbi:MAG: astA, partial [Bacteriovoracaceae bacterium]|nr:astA [Bacteriovoracaceae bacterium]
FKMVSSSFQKMWVRERLKCPDPFHAFCFFVLFFLNETKIFFMFLVREVFGGDLEAVLDLMKLLDVSVSLSGRDSLRKQIDRSIRSFSANDISDSDAVYMFVLEDIYQKLILGTSLVLGTHDSNDGAQFDYDIDRPSKMGGFVLHPDYRGLPLNLEKHLSYARLMYMSLHLERFEKNIIAQNLPPIVKAMRTVSLSDTRLFNTGNLALVGFNGSKGFGCLFVHHQLDDSKLELTEDAVHLLKLSGANLEKLYLIAAQ